MRNDRQDGEQVPTGSDPTKREYRRPELRELGTLAELTQTTNAGGPGGDSSYNTSQ